MQKNGKRDQFELKLPMPLEETGNMTEELAVELAQQHPAFSQCFNKDSITRTSFILEPKVRAELSFHVKEEKKDKKKNKDKKKVEKLKERSSS